MACKREDRDEGRTFQVTCRRTHLLQQGGTARRGLFDLLDQVLRLLQPALNEHLFGLFQEGRREPGRSFECRDGSGQAERLQPAGQTSLSELRYKPPGET